MSSAGISRMVLIVAVIVLIALALALVAAFFLMKAPAPATTTPIPINEMKKYFNFMPKWSISYPRGWKVETAHVPYFDGVRIYSNYGNLTVMWSTIMLKEEVREWNEDRLRDYGTLKVLEEKKVKVSGNVPATLVFYSWDTKEGTYWVVVRYFSVKSSLVPVPGAPRATFGFAIQYICNSGDNDAVNIFESIVSTFKLGE